MTTDITTRKASGPWALLCAIVMALIGAFGMGTVPTVALAASGGTEDTGSNPAQGDMPDRNDWRGLKWVTIWDDSSNPENPPQGTTADSNYNYWNGIILARTGKNAIAPDAQGATAARQDIQAALQAATNAALAQGTDPAYARQARIVGVHLRTATNANYPVASDKGAWTSAFDSNELRAPRNSDPGREVPRYATSGNVMWDDSTVAKVWAYDKNDFATRAGNGTHRYQFVAVTRGIEVEPPTKSVDSEVAYVGNTTTYHIRTRVITPPDRLTFSDDLDTMFDPSSVSFKVTKDGQDRTSDFTMSKNGQRVTITSKASTPYGVYDCAITARLTSNTMGGHRLITQEGNKYRGYYEIDNTATVNGLATNEVPAYTPGFYLEVQKGSYDQNNIPADFDEHLFGNATYTLYTDDGGKPSGTVATTVDGRDGTFDTAKDTSADYRKYFAPGTYWLVETKAPQGFDTDPEPIRITFSGDASKVAYSTKAHDVRLTSDGDGIHVTVRQRNAPTMGGVKVRKVDADFFKLRNGNMLEHRDGADASGYDPATPEGGASLAGARFVVYNVSGSDVVIHGHRIPSTTADAVRDAKRSGDYSKIDASKVADIGDRGTMTTNADGLAQTSTDALVWGTYAIVETSAPEGYLNDSVVRTFDVRDEGVLVDLTQVE